MTDLAVAATMPRKIRRTFPAHIRDVVARRYGLTNAEIEGDCRRRTYSRARHIAIYLMMRHTRIGSLRIGKLFNHRDHSTIFYAIRKIERQILEDDKLAAEIAELAIMIWVEP